MFFPCEWLFKILRSNHFPDYYATNPSNDSWYTYNLPSIWVFISYSGIDTVG